MRTGLKQLPLLPKQRFQLLNTLCFSSQQKKVLFRRQRNKILGAIVVLNSIKMMNYPAFRQKLVVGLLPHQDMFTNIPPCVCSWVVREMHKYIIPMSISATSPIKTAGVTLVKIIDMAWLASSRTIIYCLATITALAGVFFFPLFHSFPFWHTLSIAYKRIICKVHVRAI